MNYWTTWQSTMEGLQVRNMTIRRPRKAVLSLLFKTSFPGPLHTSAQPIQSDIKFTAINHCAIKHGWKVVKENSKQLDYKTVVFFLKISKEIGKRALTVLRARSARASHARRARDAYFSRQVSLSVFSLVPDLLFHHSHVLEYAQIRTVLQSIKQSIINVLASNSSSLWFCKPRENKGIH